MNAKDDRTLTGGHMLSDHRVVLSLGSNLGDRLDNLQEAVDALFDAPGLTLRGLSRVYETAPWGGVEQDDFLNIIAVATTRLAPMTLLDRVLSIEESMRRERVIRWGPRTLDIDIVAYEGVTSNDPRLMLPHPRAHERAFVLAPWAEVDPEAVLEPHGRVVDLLAGLTDQVVTVRDDLALQLPS
ncbi:2-amino-4-hydroxy-6-hydroxymethyldihydropteridine diphosphokinase [Actinocorallia sp. A-T 12471]|uniref:2-amino-4-hydroxy-6- hydroxymethyldihydropteridine diphosphokinase n=1 Tax=Actinocorallia sp. A-T 12471 TaxID=3089813 RepID=UPI0029CEDFB2|nr:2-amino-4-hydroxy-6-hydroxymethyldihydropteridine diphosphokinase [Actinocorallia sp. A-T 12471]MDX6741820.1 2-amino-4-hydroxy-6-hydroxymethyldihydropteridine diphosphokinase [Actinocorallia sp. A-T 12471]